MFRVQISNVNTSFMNYINTVQSKFNWSKRFRLDYVILILILLHLTIWRQCYLKRLFCLIVHDTRLFEAMLINVLTAFIKSALGLRKTFRGRSIDPREI